MGRGLEKSGGPGGGWRAARLCCRAAPCGVRGKESKSGWEVIDLGAILRNFLQGCCGVLEPKSASEESYIFHEWA